MPHEPLTPTIAISFQTQICCAFLAVVSRFGFYARERNNGTRFSEMGRVSLKIGILLRASLKGKSLIYVDHD